MLLGNNQAVGISGPGRVFTAAAALASDDFTGLDGADFAEGGGLSDAG